jgi:Tol biopolymer transport system component
VLGNGQARHYNPAAMNIVPGARIGSYEIGELLGEGGMGTVYRALDSRLGRDVAIKIVRPELAAHPDRVARFDREARLLASLSHPNIATVHGLEHSGDTPFLILELVPGITLSQRLREGDLPLREALTYAQQMAAGISAAHDQGIIHRDLKPANIKITPAGTIKILDFGLAKALALDSAAQAAAASSTLTSAGTAEGVLVGTAAYMSPEQARGKDVDKRTDVWAFGCVLYDMLTGRAAFAGDTLSDTIAAILTREPDWSRLPGDVPEPVRRLLRRCLQKDLNRRLRDLGDARIELEDVLGVSSDDRPRPEVADGSGPVRIRRTASTGTLRVAGGLLAAAVLGAAGYAVLLDDDDLQMRPTAHFVIALPGSERLAGLDFPAVALAPADTHLAYVGTRGGTPQLFVRALASLEAQPLTGTEGALGPFFSPDGTWIAFFAAGKLKKVPVAGGPVREIADAEIGFGGVWAPDDTIIFAPNNASSLMRVDADGGTPEPITTLDTARGEFSHRWPELLPDGKTVLFTSGTDGSWDDAEIVVQRVGSTERRALVQGGSAPRYAATGHVLYVRGGLLHALPFDPRTQRAVGAVLTDQAEVLQSVDGAAQVTVSAAGSVLYVPRPAGDSMRTLAWVDRSGALQPLAAPSRAYGPPRLSMDDRRIAVAIGTERTDVWTYDIAGNRFEQLTFAGGSSPEWSPGRRIVFAASRGGPPDIFAKASEGGGNEERMTTGPGPHVPHAVAPDGSVVFVRTDAGGRDIGVIRSDHSMHSLLATPANEYAPALSPDGRWLAYVSDTSGSPEIYVSAFADPSRAVLVSKDGGAEPRWRRTGEELYFRAGPRMMAAAVRTRPTLAVLSPRELFSGTYQSGEAGRPAYDVSLDGSRFLMVRPPDAAPPGRELRLFLGWRPKSGL